MKVVCCKCRKKKDNGYFYKTVKEISIYICNDCWKEECQEKAMKFKKFKNIFKGFKRKQMKGMSPQYSKAGVIEENFEEMFPYLEKAYKLGAEKGENKK